MKLSIIAINWWGDDFKEILISSLEKNTASKYEIIIVENHKPKNEMQENLWEDIKYIYPSTNLGHGGGLELAIEQAQGEYIAIMDIDAHILLKDWDKKLIKEFEDKDYKLAGATDSGLLKPMRPLFMFFKRKDIIDNKISFKAVELSGVKFDVGIHCYYRMLTMFGDKSILKLPYKKTDFKDVLGNEYTLNGERLVYHNWYGTRWYNVDGERAHDKIDGITWEDFKIKKDNLFKQL